MAISVTPGEWAVMEELWKQPRTLMELVRTLGKSEGWAKSTVTTMIRRMTDKELIRFESDGKTKTFMAAVSREDVVAEETTSLLKRAYNGSIGLLVNAMAQRNTLSKSDIDELYAILQKAEDDLQ
ncbi:MAG: BlaI/MecI/CopY family transcriptional regulator [Oscillospiraceae bacterium]|nr:BlaI/MecI/CopY family transcriptional regulator [Oscillospiraceae bacterium]